MDQQTKNGDVFGLEFESILGQLRSEIGRNQTTPSPSLPESDGNHALAADLLTLRSDYDIYNTQFTSHRRFLGRFIILGKKLFREFLNPILARQVRYNGANARVAAPARQSSGHEFASSRGRTSKTAT
jgi:hypothetical protein